MRPIGVSHRQCSLGLIQGRASQNKFARVTGIRLAQAIGSLFSFEQGRDSQTNLLGLPVYLMFGLKIFRIYHLSHPKVDFGSSLQTDILRQHATQLHGLKLKASFESTIIGFLTWTKSNFAAIPPDLHDIAALARINRENELAVIFRPLPIISPSGELIAIAGNMNDERNEPAFIKINEDCIGSSFAIQNHREFPLAIHSEIPLPTELLRDTTWEEAQEDIVLATFSIMVPIPFGAVIPDNVTPGEEFIEAFVAISSEHGGWAKLITERIEQRESDNDHVTIFWCIIDARSLRGEPDPAHAATRGIRSLTIPTTSPFIETTRIGNKFPDALAILRNDFMLNPTPARIQDEASDDKDHPEVLIVLQSNQQTQQLHQQPQNLAPQQQPQQPVPEQPV